MSAWRQALVDRQTAVALIRSGLWLSVAGDESMLLTLPPGNWMGGTIPYFMGSDGGCTARDQVFVTVLDELAGFTPWCRFYDSESLHTVCTDAPDNGFSLVILPAFSAVHSAYARHAPAYEEMFLKPVVGWVAGVHLDDVASRQPLVIDGRDGSRHHDRAAVMHVPLPPHLSAEVNIVNLFQQGPGDVIRFEHGGFEVGEALVNGERRSFAAYLQSLGHDSRWPLVADYQGAGINVSFRSVDAQGDRVQLYGPVFPHVDYRLALPFAGRYDEALVQACTGLPPAHFSCNCVLNHFYGELEGRHTGEAIGPMTFGEVGYQLLNQTMVHLSVGLTR